MAEINFVRMQAKEQHLTAELLRQELSYDPDTGEFVRRKKSKGRQPQKCNVGTISPHGYQQIRVLYTRYHAHRLAWLYVHGDWPSGYLDHINGDTLDNRMENLRVVTKAQNSANQGKQCRNTSGHKGVYWDKNRGKWTVQIGVNRRYKYLGRYDTVEEAAQAYAKGAALLHGEFARLE